MTSEIKIGGFGGQGVILAGMIIGRAAAIHDNMNSTLIQSFGPEARGSACSAQLMVSKDRILYPYVTRPDTLVVMSQEAYTKFLPETTPDAMILYEKDLVQLGDILGERKAYGIPATRFAEELGRKIVLNLVMVGFYTAITGLVDMEAMKKAVRESVPKGTEDFNLQAFTKGYNYGKELRA